MIILLYIIKEQPGLTGETRRAWLAWPRRARPPVAAALSKSLFVISYNNNYNIMLV